MKRRKQNCFFGINYSDLVICMFFIMQILFIVCLVKVSKIYKELMREKQKSEQILAEIQTTNEQLLQIIQSDKLFNEQSNTSRLGYVNIQDTEKLKIYYPLYSRIDLVCGEMPSKNDDNVILTCAAAFTVKCLDKFSHSNIIGNHVSSGVFYSGAPSKTYRGAFSFYDGVSHFAYDNWIDDFNKAASLGGCGFAQDMMIHNGEIVNYWRDDDSKAEFRALCLLKGKVAIIDTKGTLKFGDFVRALKDMNVDEAIYLDMGGWKHSWYRDSNDKPIDIYPNPNKYATNWITFYK